jgi:thymidine kinase
MKKNIKGGRLDVICGPMFAGKSEELVKRLRRFKIAGIIFKVFNHALDIRYSKNSIASHSKDSWKAYGIADPQEILKKVTKRTQIVVIDEVQFFNKEILTVINELLLQKKHVIVAGLDTNFRGEPFGTMPDLLALADGEIVKLKAVCAICKKWTATRTQRILQNGKPAPFSDPLVKIGALDLYQARCRAHHEVPQA